MSSAVPAVLLGSAAAILASIWRLGYRIEPLNVRAVLLVMATGMFTCVTAGPLWFLPGLAAVTVAAWVLMGVRHG
jgi:hypothetical protein